jgi:hypothetical protein
MKSRTRNLATIFAISVVFSFASSRAGDLNAMQEIHCNVDGTMEVITGSWICGLQGCGMNAWGDEKETHAGGTLVFKTGEILKVWYSAEKEGDRHVIELGIGESTVQSNEGPDPRIVPPTENIELKDGQRVYFKVATAHDHPDIRKIWVAP